MLAGPGCYVGVDGDDGSSSISAGPTAGLTQGDSGSSGSAGSDSAGSDSAGSDSAGDDPPPALEPAAASLRLLLHRHYRNAIRDLLGDGPAAVVAPPKDTPINGFDAVGSAQLALSDASVEIYETSARAAAAAAMGDMARIEAYLGCAPTGPDDAACHGKLVATFGRLAWRRPLTDAEVARYVAVAQQAALDSGDFFTGVENVIAALLQSPYFLYMVEVGAADPEDSSRRYLTGHEMATRLAFFLTDSTPAPWLLDAADDGLLDDADGIREVATLLLEEPAAKDALDNYFSEVLRLRELDTLAKDPAVWPQWSPGLAQAMRTETLLLLQDIIWQRDGDFRDYLDAPYTFANNQVGPLYGLTPPGGGEWGDGFLKTPLPEASKRGGILGQGALMSVLAHISSTSPTLRGKFIREALLCESIPAPPGNVSTVIPPAGEAAPTMRERLEQHLTDPGCAACHMAMDPIGFGLENYDGIGIFRTMENGAEIDTVSEVNGATFDGARELGGVLKQQRAVSVCVIRNLFRHGAGHIETSGELPTLIDLEETFEARGFSLKALLVDLVANPAFRMVGTPE
ncbi:MAG: DUF1588 domain-containing protein [Nannocystaceae bacterium]